MFYIILCKRPGIKKKISFEADLETSIIESINLNENKILSVTKYKITEKVVLICVFIYYIWGISFKFEIN